MTAPKFTKYINDPPGRHVLKQLKVLAYQFCVCEKTIWCWRKESISPLHEAFSSTFHLKSPYVKKYDEKLNCHSSGMSNRQNEEDLNPETISQESLGSLVDSNWGTLVETFLEPATLELWLKLMKNTMN